MVGDRVMVQVTDLAVRCYDRSLKCRSHVCLASVVNTVRWRCHVQNPVRSESCRVVDKDCYSIAKEKEDVTQFKCK